MAIADHVDLAHGGDLVLIEDDDLDAELIERYLTRAAPRWRLRRATTLADGIDLVMHTPPDVVLVDLNLPDASGLMSVESLLEQSPRTPLIVGSGVGDDDVTTQALKLGAQDYLVKHEITADSLERSIRYSLARHRAQTQLDEASEEIAAREAEIGDYAHVIAHDLRGPVRTARLLADRLLDRLEITDELSLDLATRLEGSLERVDGMILSMLDYAGLGHDLPQVEPVSLHAALYQARESLAADLEAAEASLVTAVDPLVQVWGDVDLLQRVAANLLSNSVKYRHADRRLVLRFTMDVLPEFVDLSLVDNGTGVAVGNRERVFRPLERAHPNAAPGLGFGLAICRRIVEAFGGAIWLEESESGGATVTMRLRRAHDIGQIELA